MVTQPLTRVFKITHGLRNVERKRRNSLTKAYLKRKLKRLDERITHGKAKDADYVQRDRVAIQIEDVRKFR